MILNLFRVEKISVEGMMSHSFKEHGHLRNQKKYKKELTAVKEKMKDISLITQQHGPHWEPLSKFYDIAAEYLRLLLCVRVRFLFFNFVCSQRFSFLRIYCKNF
jgi:superfamily II RNA helicase